MSLILLLWFDLGDGKRNSSLQDLESKFPGLDLFATGRHLRRHQDDGFARGLGREIGPDLGWRDHSSGIEFGERVRGREGDDRLPGEDLLAADLDLEADWANESMDPVNRRTATTSSASSSRFAETARDVMARTPASVSGKKWERLMAKSLRSNRGDRLQDSFA